MSGRWQRDERTRLFDWRAAIVESSLPPSTRLVALVLSLHMNRAGESCFPGTPLLVQQTGLSRSGVLKHVRELERLGWVRSAPEPGRGRPNSYVATFPEAVVAAIVAQAQTVHQVDTSTKRPPTVHQPSTEPPAPNGVEGVRPGGREDVEPPDFATAWEAYPKRAGTNSRADAVRQYGARRREGVAAEDLLAGVQRYAAYIRAKGDERTEYVMGAARFFGRGRHWEEPWEPPVVRTNGDRPTARMAGKDWAQ